VNITELRTGCGHALETQITAVWLPYIMNCLHMPKSLSDFAHIEWWPKECPHQQLDMSMVVYISAKVAYSIIANVQVRLKEHA